MATFNEAKKVQHKLRDAFIKATGEAPVTGIGKDAEGLYVSVWWQIKQQIPAEKPTEVDGIRVKYEGRMGIVRAH